MATKSSAGFTIIETLLFLAISGTLIVALLAGTGASINIQRYRDATESFKNLLQSQYGELISVRNDRDDNWTCDATGKTTQQATTLVKGQSNCVLLGRYITVVGNKVTLSSVTAYNIANTVTGNDIQKLKANYVLNISTVNKDTAEMEWGTQIAWPVIKGTETMVQGATARSIAILLVRSPDSGLIYTFTSNTVPPTPTNASLGAMMVLGIAGAAPNVGQKERYICIDSTGLLNLNAPGVTWNNSTASIYISPYATGPTAIETRTNVFIKGLSPVEALRC